MQKTGSQARLHQPIHAAVSGDEKPGSGSVFQAKLGEAVAANQLNTVKQLLQLNPDAWANICPDELGRLLLTAVKKGYTHIVNELIARSAPGKVAALATETQLALVEAARLERNSQEEMAQLLDALLQNDDFPMQHLENLIACCNRDRKYAVIAALSDYKNAFATTRSQQPHLRIYDAAAAGDAAALQRELDAQLGIPPLDNSLSGIDWFFNALHRWVMEVVTAGAAKTLVNQKMGNVPLLHAAVASNNENTVRILLDKGAETSVTDREGHSALSRAIEQKNAAIQDLLIKRHAPDCMPATGRTLLPQAGMACASHSDESKVFFNQQLKDAAQTLSFSVDVQSWLNHNEQPSVEQARLLAAGFLAEYEPSRTGAGSALTQAQLEQVRAAGIRLEASRAADIGRVFDNLVSDGFVDVSVIPPDIQRHLRDSGLCNMLTDLACKALANAQKDKNWLSASDESRKGIFIACLRTQLNQAKHSIELRRSNGTKPTTWLQLLQRQIALIEQYCTAGEKAAASQAPIDFSDDFR